MTTQLVARMVGVYTHFKLILNISNFLPKHLLIPTPLSVRFHVLVQHPATVGGCIGASSSCCCWTTSFSDLGGRAALLPTDCQFRFRSGVRFVRVRCSSSNCNHCTRTHTHKHTHIHLFANPRRTLLLRPCASFGCDFFEGT